MKKGRKSALLCLITLLALFVCVGEVQAAKVKLNKSKVTMYVGKTVTLKVTGSKQKVTWKSSKKKVATVNAKGKVIAKKAGTTIISAKLQKKTYKCKIMVKNPCLNKKSVTLQNGKKVTLKLNGTKAKKWSSSNKKVATVNSKGKVTAKSVGESTISCKGQNGKTYRCKVTVMAKKGQPDDNKQEETKPDDSASGDTTPGDTTPSDTTPGDTTPDDTTPGDTIPGDTTPDDTRQEESVHTHEFVCTQEIPSTCSQFGTKEYTCKTCGEKKTEYTDRKEHEYEVIDQKEATCYEDGYITYKCKVCQDSYTLTLSYMDAHEWVEEYVPPTCASVGGIWVHCKICQSEFWRDLEDVLPHEYEITVRPPTCTEYGSTLYQCKNCEDEYVTDYQEMLECEYERKIVKEPSCEYCGYISLVCKHCEHRNREVWEELEPLGHTTKIELIAGEKKGKCEVCEKELFTVKYDNSHLSNVNKEMIYAKEHTIFGVPGLYMQIDFDSYTAEYSTEDVTIRLEDGTYVEETVKTTDADTGEEIEEVISYYKNDVVKVMDNKIQGIEMGETKVAVYWGDKKIDEIPVSIEGCSLAEAVRRKLAGSTEDVTKGYLERYVTMVDNTVAIFQEVTTEDMTKFEKAKALFQWMEDNITYGTSGTIMHGQKAWETINEKIAVCGGYAETTSFFMDVLEIPNYYMVHIPPDTAGHAWNMIQIDTGNGKGVNWYYVDTTWGDYNFNTTVDEMNAQNVQPGLWGLHRATDGFKCGVGYYLGNKSHTEQIDGSYISPLYE